MADLHQFPNLRGLTEPAGVIDDLPEPPPAMIPEGATDWNDFATTRRQGVAHG